MGSRLLTLSLLALVEYADAFVSKTPTLTRQKFRTDSAILASTADVGTQAMSEGVASYEIDFEAYAKGYKTVFTELPAAECEALPGGKIPSDLKGTYYRTGPAMFSAGSIAPPKTSIIQPREGPPVPDGVNPKRMVQHPFEADGGILGVTFQGNGETVTSRYRYIRTVAFTNERRKGVRLYRAMDSTRELGPGIGEGLGNDLHTPLFRHHLLPGLNKFRKNTSNSRAVYWGSRLLSMWEGGQPYKVDSLALSTEGRSQLGGVLKEMDPLGSKLVIDPIKNRALVYAVNQDAKKSEVTVYEFNSAFRPIKEEGGKVSQELPGFAMISDMAVTENYSVFVQPPLSTAMQIMFVKEPGKVLTVEKAPSTLHMVPRIGSGKVPMSIPIPYDGAVEAEMQLINAYEDGTKIILDAIRADGTNKPPSSKVSQWPWASSLEEYRQNAAKKSLWRYEIDIQSGSVSKERLTDTQCFFGVVNPKQSTQQHKQIYMAIGGLGSDVAPPQGVTRFDTVSKTMDSWMPEGHEFCGEPMFAPKENPSSDDDGYILTVLFNGKTEQSEMVVLQAMDISEGPVARIPLGIGIPHGLHGCFASDEEATWSGEEIRRRAKLHDKMESRGNRWNEVKSDFSGLGLRLDDLEEYFGDSFLS
jgi:all-trans-8'-apo-beta-carotenal 15,15'-oxygenase